MSIAEQEIRIPVEICIDRGIRKTRNDVCLSFLATNPCRRRASTSRLHPVRFLILFVSLLISAVAWAEPVCPNGNLAAGAVASGAGVRGDPGLLTDGKLLQEGAKPDSGVLVLPDTYATATIDLGHLRRIHALIFQADSEQAFLFETSHDAKEWTPVWHEPHTRIGRVARLRPAQLVTPILAWYLRVRGLGEVSDHRISEVQVYCQPPKLWPPAEFRKLRSERKASILGIGVLKVLIGSLGVLLLGWGAWLRRRGRSDVLRRPRDLALAMLGLTALMLYWNFFHFHFDRYQHKTDLFHYYIGAKYFKELRYTRLYSCTTVVDVEDGYGDLVRGRRVRDLETDTVKRRIEYHFLKKIIK